MGYSRNNKKCHGIEFYYIIKPKQQLQIELKDIDLRPSNIKDMIINGEYLKGLSHIVKRG